MTNTFTFFNINKGKKTTSRNSIREREVSEEKVSEENSKMGDLGGWHTRGL